MNLDDAILDALVRMMPPSDDPAFDFIVCMNVCYEVQATTPANLSPRARIRRWSQNA